MNIIPVIDIRRGVAVHARRGERTLYRPIKSALLTGADPLALLRAYRNTLESRSVYVADLDAITGHGENRAIIAEMASSEPQLELLVDTGIRNIDEAHSLIESGAKKVIIASESLTSLDAASRLLGELGAERTVFSIDMRDQRVIWKEGSLESRNPYEVAALLVRLGCREAILLEMQKIGTAGGADAGFVREITRTSPDMRFIVGGGIREATDLVHLKRAGASGVLLATALHDGSITRNDLIRLGLDH
ncbi:MAG: HisA/HisF-related TIM barrel protein [Candidatus Methylomirabilis sp.]